MNSKTFRYVIPTGLFVFVISLFVVPVVSAQQLKRQSVARLVADPISESFSRPRRVSETTAEPSLLLENASTFERHAFENTNAARAAIGLAPLVWDAELCRMAREHSQHMATQGYFAHETPEGLDLKRRAQASGVRRFKVIAENIAYNKGYEDPGAFAVERWMMSAGHRANILEAEFQVSAIGSYIAADGSVYLTQVFIAR